MISINVKDGFNSKESEMMILGCCLTSNNCLNTASVDLDEIDFYYTQHKSIFKVLKEAYKKDKPADIHIVAQELKRQDILEEIGGVAYLTTLAQFAGTGAYVEEYVQIVKDKSFLRKMLDFTQKTEQSILKEPGNPSNLVNEMKIQLEKINFSSTPKQDLPSIINQNTKAKAVYDSRKAGELLGLKLNSFLKIQEALEGLQEGFYLIGADSNIGKSALEHNLFLDVVISNPDVIALFFSLDDSSEDILTRMRANIAGVEINDVKAPWRLDKEDKMKLNNAYKKLNELDGRLIVLDHELVKTFSNLIHFIERAKAQNPGKNLVVFIDAILNLDVEEDSSKQIRELNITRANKLKEIAKEYSMPLVCTVELRKRNKPEEFPSMSDIMETGKFAYNANVVMLLHSTQEEMEKEETKVNLFWPKNKLSGHKKSMDLFFTRKRAQIGESSISCNNNGF